MKMRTLKTIVVALMAVLLASCSKSVEPAKVKVKDPVRHYYPILTSQELTVKYEIENVSENPFVIHEVLACCGCTVDEDRSAKIILPGKTGAIVLHYNSDKNVGRVEQKIRVYGNVKPNGMLLLQYDVNVVPGADYTRDYEQLYKERMDRENSVEELVNGTASQKGYYVNLDD